MGPLRWLYPHVLGMLIGSKGADHFLYSCSRILSARSIQPRKFRTCPTKSFFRALMPFFGLNLSTMGIASFFQMNSAPKSLAVVGELPERRYGNPANENKQLSKQSNSLLLLE